MQRAAAALAAAVARAAVRLRGRVYGARVLILVGPGNNGGDALFAGPGWPAAGRAVTAVRCLGTPHAARAGRAAGGRRPADRRRLDLVRPRAAPRPVSRPGGRRRPRHRRPAGSDRPVADLLTRDLAGRSIPSSRSTCRRASAPTPARCPARPSGPPTRSPSASSSPATCSSRRRQRCGEIERGRHRPGRPIPAGTSDLWLRQCEAGRPGCALALSRCAQRQVRPRRGRRRHRLGPVPGRGGHVVHRRGLRRRRAWSASWAPTGRPR